MDPLAFAILVAVVAALAALGLGYLLGRAAGARRGKFESPPPNTLPASEDDGDEPTAPIVPMVEMSRSPHDRHRDLAVGRSIVKRIDLLEDMIRHAAKRRDAALEEQLTLLRTDFLDLLRECSVEAFTFVDGDIVTSEVRGEIRIVGGQAVGKQTVIAETLLCGFRYRQDEEESMILRKAEVRIR